jgi:hypothetical protein
MMQTMLPNAEILDEALALSSVGGDREFLSEVVGLVQAAWPTLLAEIRERMARRDLPAVKWTASLAKAAARNVSAKRAYESALHLETMAGKGEFQAAQGAAASLEREVERLRLVLSSLASFDRAA